MTIQEIKRRFYQLFHRKPDMREEEQIIYMAQRRLPEDMLFEIPADKGD